MYSIRFRAWLEKDGRFVMGEGRAALLRGIRETGSLRAAAAGLGISYRHAWGMLKEMSRAAGAPLTRGECGGAGHGRTVLTARGEELLRAFEHWVRALQRSRGPWLTVDGLVREREGILLVRRRNPPFEGRYALPGGFVEAGETVEEAVVREVREETGLRTRVTGVAGVYSDPRRDPRGHTVSIVLRLRVTGGTLRGGDDAAEAAFFRVGELPRLAFDHDRVVRDLLRAGPRKRPPPPPQSTSPPRGSQGRRSRA
ncbi:MAG: NUDIX domain-containing protein [Thermoplasmatota archaeon]